MNPLLVGPLLELGKGLIDRIFPDKVAQAKERADAEARLWELANTQAQIQADALGKSDANQTQINVAEASSENLFKSGWRPAIGWVGALSLFCYYVPYTLAGTIMWIHQCYMTQSLLPRPDLGITDLLGLIGGMLGMGVMRSYDKKNGLTNGSVTG